MDNCVLISKRRLAELIALGAVEIRGFSGIAATLEDATEAPRLCQVHSKSGIIYDLEYFAIDETFRAKPVAWAKGA